MSAPLPAAAILGRAIRQLRQDRDITQEALADASGLHPTWISRVETGRLNPSWSNVVRMCDALEVTLEDFGQLVDRLRGELAESPG